MEVLLYPVALAVVAEGENLLRIPVFIKTFERPCIAALRPVSLFFNLAIDVVNGIRAVGAIVDVKDLAAQFSIGGVVLPEAFLSVPLVPPRKQ